MPEVPRMPKICCLVAAPTPQATLLLRSNLPGMRWQFFIFSLTLKEGVD